MDLEWKHSGTPRSKAVAAAQMGGFVAMAYLSWIGDSWGVERLIVEHGRVDDIDLVRLTQRWKPAFDQHLPMAALRSVRLTDLIDELAETQREMADQKRAEDRADELLKRRSQARELAPYMLGLRRAMDLRAHVDRLTAAYVYEASSGASPVATVSRLLASSIAEARTLVAQARRDGYLTSPGHGVARGETTALAEEHFKRLMTALDDSEGGKK